MLLLGTIIERINSRIDKKKYRKTGNLVEVNGKRMHVFTEGNNEKRIVLVSGLATHSPYVNYQPLWHRLSKDYRVIVLERFGYGFSDLTKNERSIKNIIQEMNLVLKLSDEKPPYTLIGHSMGGSICIAYAQAYPEEVSNIVMLDAPLPNVYITEIMRKDLWGYIIPVFRLIGLLRVQTLSEKNMQKLRSSSNEYRETPKSLWNIDRSCLIRNFYNSNVRNERLLLEHNMRYIAENKYPYNIPTLFITTFLIYEVFPDLKNVQSDYIKNTRRSKLVELDGHHFIHQYFPDEISEVISDFITINYW